MANEFKHKDVGIELSRVEWEGITTHEADGQTAGDMLYFNGTNWIRATRATLVPLEIYASVMSPAPASLGVLVDEVAEYAILILLVPQDFNSITALEVIFLPTATEADMHFQIVTSFGAYDGNENHNAHSETGNARDIGATVNIQNLAYDISDLVTGLATGDLLQVRVNYDATAVASNAFIRGIRLKYN